MNKLYLRIPANLTAVWPDGALDYALCSKEGAIQREGRSTLIELSKDIYRSKIVLIIAAADVTLLEIAIPAIPESKLKLALPNLVEDYLMTDSSECVLTLITANQINPEVAEDGSKKRVVAIAARSWLQQLSDKLYELGAAYVKALPAQFAMPWQPGSCSVMIEDFAPEVSTHYAMRFGADKGTGILLEAEQKIEQRLTNIMALAPAVPLQLQLPRELIDVYQAAIQANPIWAERITIQESNWLNTIAEIKKIKLNLLFAINSAQTSRIQWRIWRWPIALAVLTLIVNLVGLNIQYWGLKREAEALKTGMAQTYKMSFPKDAVVPYPLDQMKKNLDIAKRNAGEPANDDFTVLITSFGSAWSSISSQQPPKIKSIEYKDDGLLLQVDGNLPQEALKRALMDKGLSLKKNNAEVWQIKVEK